MAENKVCNQERCGFNIHGGCKSCSQCDTNPNVINQKCGRCVACETIPNSCRWDEDLKNKPLLKEPYEIVSEEEQNNETIVFEEDIT